MNWTPEVVCPVCSSATAMRINRTGFLQRHVLSLFGIYPWKCGSCGSIFLFRRRGRAHK
jgi:DNA-directed RNA polymerase subunit RPC12/RpoP